ncbi:hypothetical protein D3C75_1108750 [compost metagenome]
MQFAIGFAQTTDAIIHPCTTALVLAGIQVQIEAAAQFTFGIEQIEETHLWMPSIDTLTLFGGNAVNAVNHFEQPFQHTLFREIWAQLLITDGEQILLLFFSVITDIPSL